jgi:hypothetical protein
MTSSSPRPTPTFTERASRWLAARSSRRSFLGTVGKLGLVAAGGSLLSQVMTERAEARVCGQSGVSPKCPTYDCFAPSVWGWCWYAGNASCCADGGLKKICDCCRANHPNVHGYCPEGSNVYCVVESCLEDPRVMKVLVTSHSGATGSQLSVHRTSALAAGSSTTVVISHPTDRLLAAIAAPVAALRAAATLTTATDTLAPEVTTEIARLGATRIVIVGTGFDAGIVAGFATLPGVTSVEHIGANPSVAGASIEVARWLIAQGAKPNATVTGAGNLSVLTAPAVGAYSALAGAAVLIGTDAASAFRSEFPTAALTFIGEASAGAQPADKAIAGTDALTLSRKLADDRFSTEPNAQFPLAIAVEEAGAHTSVLSQVGTLTILHAPDVIDAATRDWLFAHRGRLTAVHVSTGTRSGLAEPRIYEVQSAINGFNAHLLTGSDGMGLPVVPLPNEEKPLGQVRVTGPAPSTSAKPLSKRTKATTTVKLTQKPTSVPATTTPMTTQPMTTQPVTTQPVTTQPAPTTTVP